MKNPISLDDYYDLTTLSELALSPDGDRVAFVATEFDRSEEKKRPSLFVVNTDDSSPPHRLTRASGAKYPRWSPDGTKLGFVATRDEELALELSNSNGDTIDDDDGTTADDSSENDDPDPQVWAFDLERGGDARQVTRLEDGVSEFDWAPEGDRLVVASRDPTDEQREYLDTLEEGGPIETERLQHKYDGSGWLDDVRTYLFVVDYESRETRRFDDAHDGGGLVVHQGGMQPRWSPDGSLIAFRSNRTETPDDTYAADLYTIDPDGSELRKVTESTLSVSKPAWDETGDRLAFLASDPENWYKPTELYVSDLEEWWSVTGDLDRTVARSGRPLWLDDETLLTAIGDEGLTRPVRAVSDGSVAERVFDAQGRDRTVRGIDHAGDTIALVLSHPGEGEDLYVTDRSELDGTGTDSTPERITAINDEQLERWETPRCERLIYESDDGTEVEALAFLPREFDLEAPEPAPLVVDVHGGPMSYDEPAFRFQDAVFTSRGYVVLKPNYRGSTSYGREFCERLKGEWNSVEVDDILAGVDAVLDRRWVDPDRLFCTGFSQGGINTAYAVTRTDRFAAAAAEHGVYDMRSAFGTDDCHRWWECDFGLPWENPDTYDRISSIDDVKRIETPLLLTAGEEDWRCPPTQAEQLYVSLTKRGVPSRLVVYPEEHHNVGDPDRAIHRFEELLEWFDRFDPESS